MTVLSALRSLALSLTGFMVPCNHVLLCWACSLGPADGIILWCTLMMLFCSCGQLQAFSSCWTA